MIMTQEYTHTYTTFSCRWRTARRAASRQTCCKQRWMLGVINYFDSFLTEAISAPPLAEWDEPCK